MSAPHPPRGRLAVRALGRLVAGFLVLLAILILPAGTLSYWEAWTYMAFLFVLVMLALVYLLAYDPALLERRMKTKERHGEQAAIVRLASACYLLVFLIPGLDKRFGLSDVPAAAVVVADVLVLLGYALFLFVLRANSYASRIVDVEEDQRVVTTGPYAIVRHPMYLAVLIMFTFTPIALGSWWAVTCALPLVAVLVARIRHEERLLSKELQGYQEYAQTTRYRLIPGVW